MANRRDIGLQIYRYFVDRGLAPHQAAAVAGNMAWEGGGGYTHVNPNDNLKNSPNSPHSAGVGQWNDRLPSLVALAKAQGVELPDGDLRDKAYVQDVINRIPLKTQLDFAWGEMQGPERYAFGKITDAGDLRSATAGAIGYHRPAGYTRDNPYAGHAFDDRQRLAGEILAGAEGKPIEEIAGPSLEPMQTVAAAAPQEKKKMDLFSMLSAFGSGAKAGASIPSAADGDLSKLFGSMDAFGGENKSSADGDLATAAARNAAGQEEQGPQMVRKPFDMAQLAQMLQQAGRLGTFRPRGGMGGGGMA